MNKMYTFSKPWKNNSFISKINIIEAIPRIKNKANIALSLLNKNAFLREKFFLYKIIIKKINNKNGEKNLKKLIRLKKFMFSVKILISFKLVLIEKIKLIQSRYNINCNKKSVFSNFLFINF